MLNFKNVFITLALLHCSLLLMLVDQTVTLTVDNQLVSARNDCFERVALEAMLPIEKTFRTEDTNSLKMCKDKCIQAGEKCQSISFGVHRRGNGTCQLSTMKYDMSNGRPSGIIFDPDFDLYARKTNCFDLADNTIPMQDSVPTDASDGYGGGLPTTPSLQIPNRVGGDPPLLVVNPTPTIVTTLEPRPPPSTGVYGSTPQYYPEGPGSTLGPNTADGDRLYFSHDIYPLYKYPMLYEHNYPAPNEEVYIPGGYASNVAEVEDRYRPGQPLADSDRPLPNGPPRPMFGLGYGTGYSYGQPEQYSPPTLRPYDSGGPVFSQLPDRRPPADQDNPSYHTQPESYHSDGHVRPNDRPNRQDYEQSTLSYYPRPEYGSSTPNRPTLDSRPTVPSANGNRPGDFLDFTNRPDPPQTGYGSDSTSPNQPVRDHDQGYSGGTQPSKGPNRYDYVRRNGTAAQQDSSSNYNDDKTIATYFNPNDFGPGSTRKRPPGNSNRDRVGYPMDAMKVYDSGSIFSPEILDIKPEDLRAKFQAGVANLASVSLQIGYPTTASAPHSVANGFKNLLAIAATTEIEFKEATTIKEYIKYPSKFAAAAATAAPATAAPEEDKKAAAKEESEEEEDDDMGFGLFD